MSVRRMRMRRVAVRCVAVWSVAVRRVAMRRVGMGRVAVGGTGRREYAHIVKVTAVAIHRARRVRRARASDGVGSRGAVNHHRAKVDALPAGGCVLGCREAQAPRVPRIQREGGG